MEPMHPRWLVLAKWLLSLTLLSTVLALAQGASWIAILKLFTMSLAALGSLLWIKTHTTREKDHLADAGLQSWERVGFCFGFAMADILKKPMLVLVYQNRFERSCEVDLVLRPTTLTADAGFPIIHASVVCPGSGHGELLFPVSFKPGAGPNAVCEVVADVLYTNGRGRCVRWPAGAAIGGLDSLEKNGRRAIRRVSIPISDLLRTPTNSSAAPKSPAPPICPETKPSVEPSQQPPNLDPRMDPSLDWRPSRGSDDLAVETLCLLLERFDLSNALERQVELLCVAQQQAVHAWRRQSWIWLVPGMVCLIVGLQGLHQHGLDLARSLIAIGGLGWCLVACTFRPGGVGRSSGCPAPTLADQPASALRGFLHAALDYAPVNSTWWTSIAAYAAFPTLTLYREDQEAALALAKRWRAFRESLAPDGGALTISEITCSPHLALGERVVGLRVRLESSHRHFVYENTAVRLQSSWVLATPEPPKPLLPEFARSPAVPSPLPHIVNRTTKGLLASTSGLGETLGWQNGFRPDSVPIASWEEYRQHISALPRPSDQQIEEFVDYVGGAHSWYKKLPLLPPGVPLVFFLDPCGAYHRVLKTDGTVRISEVNEHESEGHYNQRSTAYYHEHFGYLAYQMPAFQSTEVYVEEMLQNPVPSKLPLYCWGRRPYRVPWRVVEAGLTGATAIIQPSSFYVCSAQMQVDPGALAPRATDSRHLRRFRGWVCAHTNGPNSQIRAREAQPLFAEEQARVRDTWIQAVRRLRTMLFD